MTSNWSEAIVNDETASYLVLPHSSLLTWSSTEIFLGGDFFSNMHSFYSENLKSKYRYIWAAWRKHPLQYWHRKHIEKKMDTLTRAQKVLHLPLSQRRENILVCSTTYLCQKMPTCRRCPLSHTRILTTYMIQAIDTSAVCTETRHSKNWSEWILQVEILQLLLSTKSHKGLSTHHT